MNTSTAPTPKINSEPPPPAPVQRSATATSSAPKIASPLTPRSPVIPKAKTFAFAKIDDVKAQRIGIYGGGGLGKTTLACYAPGPVGFFDFDNSLPMLKPSLEGLDVRVIPEVETFADLRVALAMPIWNGIKTIVIDSATKALQLAVAHTLQTIKKEHGVIATGIEDYGWGKGYVYAYETFQLLLQDLDAHIRAGRNVVLIMHEAIENCPNPEGADYLRWEPRLQNQKNGNIRSSVKEWLDHLLCIRLDVAVNKDGVAHGAGSRTIYPTESAVHVAKSRILREPIVYEEGSSELWTRLFGESK